MCVSLDDWAIDLNGECGNGRWSSLEDGGHERHDSDPGQELEHSMVDGDRRHGTMKSGRQDDSLFSGPPGDGMTDLQDQARKRRDFKGRHMELAAGVAQS